ncbi:FxsB family cyclophane-forming radical SAM/SPASM peptide maturase [Nocardia sp. CY41]|uniref:FxsB family cyclophane-forming radical SAM/SPASM peptide maturase n=1 Tax=Nocardia sp. CY41 TaxID=2608686 RepID=UPI00135AA61A|nr:FxsB family cyclophane-forming radical SAM/SPASM peptide maturase [Nocardia sp. CY41]
MKPTSVALGLPVARKTWPESGVDVAGLLGKGWEPLPFLDYIIKLHSRCNLACDYCYLYEMADQSWRDQPKMMSHKVFDDTCQMIADHARRFEIPALNLNFFGGEPLLVGHRNFEYFASRARTILDPISTVRIVLQTNGVLLDDEFLRICDEWDICVTVSLDGDEQSHDRHRRDRRGAGTYARVTAGLEKLIAGDRSHLFAGLLCVIDLANDPLQTYRGMLAFQPPAVNFEIPHGNWTTPPPGPFGDPDSTPYADWLITIFDHWYDAPQLQTRIRMFDNIIDLLLGGTVRSEVFGLEPIRIAVIETDGTVEQIDDLKSAFAGATKLRTTGRGNPLDQAMVHPAIVARQIGVDALSDTCRSCPIHTVCGGGHYVTRYQEGEGFRNPSVYCADLTKLIRHIESRIRADAAAAVEGAGTRP